MNENKNKPYQYWRNIVATRQEGFDVKTITILCEVPDKDFDLVAAAKAAAAEFCATSEGRRVLDYTCGEFDWADFAMNVPNSICEKHGFRMANFEALEDIPVNWDECLIESADLLD